MQPEECTRIQRILPEGSRRGLRNSVAVKALESCSPIGVMTPDLHPQYPCANPLNAFDLKVIVALDLFLFPDGNPFEKGLQNRNRVDLFIHIDNAANGEVAATVIS